LKRQEVESTLRGQLDHGRRIIDYRRKPMPSCQGTGRPGQKEKRGANREIMKCDVGSKIHLVTPFDIRAAVEGRARE
jgi:hypothetical protein